MTWAAHVCGGFVFALTMTSVSQPTTAQEICWTGLRGQFYRAIHICVSSVLAPQREDTFGPQNLARWDGDATKAWCEGAPGYGIGETITIRIEGGVAFRRLLVGNGYGKRPEAYMSSGRVKTVEITADTGFTTTVDLLDKNDIFPVYLPKLAKDWVQLKILDIYPGERFADTCLAFVIPDFEYEEELLLREQGLLPRPQK